MMSAGLPVWAVVEALGHAGEGQAAADFIARFGRGASASPRLELTRLRATATLARTQGDAALALARLDQAAVLAERLGLPGEQWLIAVEQAGVYAAENQPQQAEAAAGQAARLRARLAERLSDPALRASFTRNPAGG